MVVSGTAGMKQEEAVRRALHSGGDIYNCKEPVDGSEKGITHW